MSDEFNLDKSRWYNTMMIGQQTKTAKNSAAVIIERTRHLLKYEYDPVIGTELAQAETELSEALLAVKLAREEFQKHAMPA